MEVIPPLKLDSMKANTYVGKRRLVLALVVSLFMVFPGGVFAQDMSPEITSLSETKDYGRPGYPRVTVYLWGNADSGVWTVEEGTDLLEFLSVAARGDFNQSAETRKKNLLRVYRRGQVDEKPIFETELDKIFARQIEYPELQDGDVYVVESIQKRRFFYKFRQVSQVTGAVASLVSLGVLLFD